MCCKPVEEIPNRARFHKVSAAPATSVETITVNRQDISRQIRSFGNIKAQ
ncbi:MAG: hypothetical protein U5K69_03795 [Balneolaceae bacterium]|nr:hypothetical protein [Balneolaceae bacterium]